MYGNLVIGYIKNQEKVKIIRECHKLLDRAEEIFDEWVLLIK